MKTKFDKTDAHGIPYQVGNLIRPYKETADPLMWDGIFNHWDSYEIISQKERGQQ